MEWKNHIRSVIQEFEVKPQNDWNTFNKKYHRFKLAKRIKRFSAIVSTVVIIGLIGYHIIYQIPQSKNIHKIDNNINNNIEKTVIVNNPIDENKTTKQINRNKTVNNDKIKKKQPNNNQAVINHNQIGETKDSNKTVNNVIENNQINTKNPAEKLISAIFSADKVKGCGTLTVQFTPKAINDSIIYLWEFGDGNFSNKKMPVHHYNSTGTFTVSLTTKHFNSNKQNQILKKDFIIVLKQPKADFSYSLSENNQLQTNNFSTNYKQCKWITDKIEYFETNPIFPFELGNHTITLLAENQWCKDSITKTIPVFTKIKMFTPTAFTPDGNGQNDEFKPVFSNLPDSYKILIFDQLGKIVFSSTNLENGWNGKINNNPPKADIYFWKIVYQQKNNKPVEKSGQVKLINY